MRILQLIDSLNPGGAERMAVNLANALQEEKVYSALCTTREEGALKADLLPKIPYFFADKRHTLDLSALFRLRKFVKQHQIEIIHAHATSLFFAVLLKMSKPSLKVIWHNHQGKSVDASRMKQVYFNYILKFVTGIIVVNSPMKVFMQKFSNFKKIILLPNFVSESSVVVERKKSLPQTNPTLISVANVRPEKDQLTLIRAFKRILVQCPNAQLTLVGAKTDQDYAQKIMACIEELALTESVHWIGGVSQPQELMQKATIGVLSSVSEGLPLVLLEYGACKLPVICTDVGDCKKVVGKNGIVVPPNDPEAIAAACLSLLENNQKRNRFATAFHQHVAKHYSAAAALPQLITFYKNCSH